MSTRFSFNNLSALDSNERIHPTRNHRKCSFPASLLSVPLSNETITAKRKLSFVSDAVARKLSYSIGWKSSNIPAQDIINQGKCLCGQYIRRRLRKSGLISRKLGLQRLRSVIGTSTAVIVREVFPTIISLGDILEHMHPHVYNSITKQLTTKPGGEIESAEIVCILLSAIARDLFRKEITWAKIISIFQVAGGIATDCIRQGHTDYINTILESFGDIIEEELVPWINENGGWLGLNAHVYSECKRITTLEWIFIGFGSLLGLMFISVSIRIFYTYILPFANNKLI